MTCIESILAAVLTLNPSWSEDRGMEFVVPICENAEQFDMDPLIITAVIHHETGWRSISHRNRNGTFDHGPMQFNCPKGKKMPWRKWWCDRKRRLSTISGGISAGVRELHFWRDHCFANHGASVAYRAYVDEEEGGNHYHRVCIDCIDSTLYLYKFYLPKVLLKRLNKSHWWVQHYNYNSKGYGKRVLFVYRALLTGRADIYQMVRNRFYVRLYRRGKLDECLLKDDLCLKEYDKWLRRKN